MPTNDDCKTCPYHGRNGKVCAACKEDRRKNSIARMIAGEPLEKGDLVVKETPLQRIQALGRMKAGTMNKTEAAYANDLKQRGLKHWFEGIKLKLADNTFYTPDFLVMTESGHLECHEVKGFWTDDARVKIKVAAALFPFKFLAIKAEAQKRGGGWKVEEI